MVCWQGASARRQHGGEVGWQSVEGLNDRSLVRNLVPPKCLSVRNEPRIWIVKSPTAPPTRHLVRISGDLIARALRAGREPLTHVVPLWDSVVALCPDLFEPNLVVLL